MHSIVTSVFGAILFFLLSPGILLRLPSNGSKMMVAMVHALVFGLVFYFAHRSVYSYFNPMRRFEGMTTTTTPTTTKPKEPFSKK
jgi:hypothetical protein